jgi:uncharacterized RDD family membrane protein YckC
MNTSTTNQSNPYAPPKAFVQDVADEAAAVEPASRLVRLGAYLLDAFIPGLLIYAPLFYGGIYDFKRMTFAPQAVSVPIWAYTSLASIALLVLTIYFVQNNGQTIGKKLLSIKVVRKDGSRASLGRIFWLRNVVSMLPSFILGGLWSIIDSLFIFGEPRQCIHDKIADTIVVKA